MNSRTRPEVNLSPVSQTPDSHALNEMVNLAHCNQGSSVQLSINIHETAFLLSATSSLSKEIHWALYSKESALWLHTTADLELVENLTVSAIEQTVCAGREKTVTTFGTHVGAAASPPENTLLESGSIGATRGENASSTSPTNSVTLAGELTGVELANVAQSIALCRMTGKLVVSHHLETIELFFDDGNLLHAILDSTLHNQPSREGDSIVLELLLWREGQFRFHPGITSSSRSIKKRLEMLLMEGAALSDHWRHLCDLGLDEDTKLVQCSGTLTDEELVATLKPGIPVDAEVQKKVYVEIDGKLTVYDITRKLHLPKTQWIPVLFNLLTQRVVQFADVPSSNTVSRPTPTGSIKLNSRESDKAWRDIMVPETKILSCPLFLHFYSQEFARIRKGQNAQFTVMIFELKCKSGSGFGVAPTFAVREIMEHVWKLKDEIDIVGHFLDDSYAMLLPFARVEQAVTMAQAITQFLSGGASEDLPFDISNVEAVFGAASAPHDSCDQELLLTLAARAKQKAITDEVIIELASNLHQEG